MRGAPTNHGSAVDLVRRKIVNFDASDATSGAPSFDKRTESTPLLSGSLVRPWAPMPRNCEHSSCWEPRALLVEGLPHRL
jgi:hypothetical protein